MGWNPLNVVKDVFEEIVSWVVDIPEAGDQGIEINVSERNKPIPVAYGQTRIDGGNWLFWTFSGTDNRYLYIWLALCEGEIEAIDEVFIDNKPLSEFANVKGGMSVSTYPNFAPFDGDNTIVIRKYPGRDDQTADAMLSSVDDRWTATHRNQGVAGMAIRLRLREDVFSGRPQISAVVRGRKVFDPRTGQIVYTENAALCLLDYMTNTRFGKGLSWDDDFDQASWIAAMDDCDATETLITPQTFGNPDEIVTGPEGENYLRYSQKPANAFVLPGASLTAAGKAAAMGAGFMSPGWYGNPGGYYVPFVMEEGLVFTPADSISGSATQRLFALNIVLNGGADPDELMVNVRKIRAVMRGNTPYLQGRYHLYVEKDRPPVFDITEKHIVGGFQWTAPKKDDKYNRVTVKFRNPNTDWKDDIAIFPPPGGPIEAAMLQEDNGTPLHHEVTLEGVKNKYQAQDIARIICYKSRDNVQASFTAFPELLNYHTGQIVTLTHANPGWNQKRFLITKRGLGDGGEVFYNLAEHTPAIFSYVDVPLDLLKDNSDHPDPFTVQAPSGLTVNTIADKLFGGIVRAGLSISWTGVDDVTVDGYEVQLKRSADAAWRSEPLQREEELEVLNLEFNTDYDVRVRTITFLGVKSDWIEVLNHTLDQDTTAPGLPTDINAVGGDRQITVSFTPPADVDRRHVEVYFDTVDSIPATPAFESTYLSNQFVIPNLQPETTYYIWLKSVDDAGNVSVESDSVPATTLAATLPTRIESDEEPDASAYAEGAYWTATADGNKLFINQSGTWVRARPPNITGLALQNADPTDPGKFLDVYARIGWDAIDEVFGYEVEVWYNGRLRRVMEPDTNGATYTYTQAIADSANPALGIEDGARNLIFRVYATEQGGLRSLSPTVLTATNDQQPILPNLQVSAIAANLKISYDVQEGTDMAGFEVHASETSGFTPGPGTLVAIVYGNPGAYVPPNPLGEFTNYFVRVGAFDYHGKDGISYSAEAPVTTGQTSSTTYRGDEFPANNGQLSEGDIFFKEDEGNNQYRWNNTTGEWDDVQDDGIIAALAGLANLEGEVDGKVQFVASATYPLDADMPNGVRELNDIWIHLGQGNELFRWNAADWVSIQDGAIATAVAVANGKQNPLHTGASPPLNGRPGDLWEDTNWNPSRLRRFDGFVWQYVTGELAGLSTVDTLQVEPGAITEIGSYTTNTQIGNGAMNQVGVYSVTMADSGHILVNVNFAHSYLAQPLDWGFRVDVAGATIANRPSMSATADQPSLMRGTAVGAGTHIVRVYWYGETSNIRCVLDVNLMGVQR